MRYYQMMKSFLLFLSGILPRMIISMIERIVRKPKEVVKSEPEQIVPPTLTRESLTRKNFTPDECFRSEAADELGINNETDNVNILTGMMKTLDKLQDMRDVIELPITITSFFRNKAVNKAVGGAVNSMHMSGLAVDCVAEGCTAEELFALIRESNISVDKCLVERGCVHIQFKMEEDLNRNFFGLAKRLRGRWVVEEVKDYVIT